MIFLLYFLVKHDRRRKELVAKLKSLLKEKDYNLKSWLVLLNFSINILLKISLILHKNETTQ